MYSKLFFNQFYWNKCIPKLQDDSSIFNSMWDWANFLPFLTYRIFFGLFSLGYLIFDMYWETIKYYHNNIGFWFIYATNWAFVLFSFTITILSIIEAINYFKPNYTFPENFSNCIFFLYTLTCVSTWSVSLVYWAALSAEKGPMKSFEAQCKHTIPSIIILFDIMLSRYILDLAHVIYPLLFGIIYIIFNVIYYLTGGVRFDGKPYVYEAVNWNDPGQAITACMIILIFTILLHGLLFIISFGKFILKTSTYNSLTNRSLSDVNSLVK